MGSQGYDRRRRHDNDGSGYRERRANHSDKQNDNSSEAYKKRTGCEMKESYTRYENGKPVHVDAPCVWGWNYSKSRGFLKFVSVPCANYKTKNERWIRMHVTITPSNGTAKWTFVGLWDIEKQRLHMSPLDMIANPKKNYWGRDYQTND